MTDQLLSVTVEKIDDRVSVLTVKGELDRDSAPVLSGAADGVLATGAGRLVLDLGPLSFCDSSGLRVLIELHRKAAARGGSLHLANVQHPVAAVFQVINLERILAIHPSVQDAVG